MKIILLSHLFPNQYSPSSGIFNLSRVKALRKLGYEVRVISPVRITPPLRYFFPVPKVKNIYKYIKQNYFVQPYRTVNNFMVYQIKWFPLPKKFFWPYQVDSLHFFLRKRIKKIFNEFKPDIIITSSLYPEGTYSKYLNKILDVVIISIAEGSEILLFHSKFRFIKKVLKNINTHSDKVVFVSRNMFEVVSNKYYIKNSVVINNGYDSDMFYFNPSKKNKKNNVYRIITVGHFDYIKGHDLLLKVITEIDNIHLTLIGYGDLLDHYKSFIANNKLEKKVAIEGFVEQKNLKSFFDKSDLFCLPSRSESFGIAALEAMACGLPVVATKVGEMPYLIKNGVNGYLAEIESVKSLKKNIIKAIYSKWDHELIANKVKINYSWAKWAKEIEKIWT